MGAKAAQIGQIQIYGRNSEVLHLRVGGQEILLAQYFTPTFGLPDDLKGKEIFRAHRTKTLERFTQIFSCAGALEIQFGSARHEQRHSDEITGGIALACDPCAGFIVAAA